MAYLMGREQVGLKKLSQREVDCYNMDNCGQPQNYTASVWHQCHSNMLVLGNVGTDDYSMQVKILEMGLQRGYTIVEEAMVQEHKLLVYDNNSGTYQPKDMVQLSVGLNVFFWCHQHLRPHMFKSEQERVQGSDPRDLSEGLNIQLLPGDGEEWDTYLLSEHEMGYSGKSDITPVNMGKSPPFGTDRVSIARKMGQPPQLLQMTWLKIIKQRTMCSRGRFSYSCIEPYLPYHQVPELTEGTTYWHMVPLQNPYVGKCPHNIH